jgi:hypothetical protein
MSYEPQTYTAEEILASTEAHATHWENEARYSDPDVAFQCRDYAKHLRTIAECLRMDLLEHDVAEPRSTPPSAAGSEEDVDASLPTIQPGKHFGLQV